jgi:hypothetical protein
MRSDNQDATYVNEFMATQCVCADEPVWSSWLKASFSPLQLEMYSRLIPTLINGVSQGLGDTRGFTRCMKRNKGLEEAGLGTENWGVRKGADTYVLQKRSPLRPGESL